MIANDPGLAVQAAAVSPAVAQVTGRPPRDVTQFARDYAPALSG
jgi:hypothetical protein